MQAILLRTDAVLADLCEELDFGLAEHIDRLHGITDEEHGPTFARLPGVEQRRYQLVLTA